MIVTMQRHFSCYPAAEIAVPPKSCVYTQHLSLQ